MAEWCGISDEGQWAPVVGDPTQLPAPPAPVVAEPVPEGAIEIEDEDWDPCADFWAQFPEGQAPVYEVTLTPESILPPFIERLYLRGVMLAGAKVRQFVDVQPTIVVPSVAVNVATNSPMVTGAADVSIHVPATAITVTASSPYIFGDAIVGVPAATVDVTADVPMVTGDPAAAAIIDVPATTVTVTADDPDVVGAQSALAVVPAAAVDVTTAAPAVTGDPPPAAVSVPAATVTVTALAPEVAGSAAVDSFLDLYPGAAAAYSLRELREVASDVVRVRRSSDDAESDFTAAQVADGTLAAWAGAGDGFVVTWYDQSGNDRHLANATTSQQPRIVSAGVVESSGSLPSIYYKASSDLLAAAGAITYYTVLSVHQAENTTPQYGHLVSFGDVSGEPTTGLNTYHGGNGRWFDSAFTAAIVRGGEHRINTGSPVDFTLTARSFGQMLTSTVNTAAQDALSIAVGNAYGDNRALRGHRQEVIVFSDDRSATLAAMLVDINSHYSIYETPVVGAYSQSTVYPGNAAATADGMSNFNVDEPSQTATNNATTGDLSWIEIDFGTETAFSRVVVGPHSVRLAGGWSSGGAYINNADIIGSNDGSNWTVLANVGTFPDPPATKTISTPGASYRYVRIRRSGYLAITEFYALP